MKRFILLASLMVVGLAACSNQQANQTADLQNSTGIIGGSPALPTDIVTPSTVSILMAYRGQPYSMCSGTLISKNLVLTATHCLKDMDISQMSVFFGDKLPTSFNDTNIVKIQAAVTHPEYKFAYSNEFKVYTGFNDVGLIRLATDAPATAKTVPVLNDTPIKDGQILLLAGFGLLQEVPSKISATGLYYTRVSIAKTFDNILVTDQTKANGACAGDSGGPAYLETSEGLIVLGITRGPHDRAPDCRHFGEYTYASRFKDFILERAAELQAELPVFVDAPAGSL